MTIKCIDIITFLKEINIQETDFLIVKMDIEGAEFNVVKRLMMNGYLKFIDKLAIEWCMISLK